MIKPKKPANQLRVMKLSAFATIPAKAHENDAGFDLFTPNAFSITPGEFKSIALNIKIAIPVGYCGLVCSRSGLAAKNGIVSHIGPGIIDADYRGELICCLRNTGTLAKNFAAGDRIAQLVIVPVPRIEAVEVLDIDETDRGMGFGSSGN